MRDIARDLDVKFQHIQNTICKVGSLMAQMLHDFNVVKEEESKELSSRLLDRGMEALECGGHANVNLNFRQ